MVSSNDQTLPGSAIPVWVVGAGGTPVGYQQITSLSTAVHMTPPTGATSALIVASGAAVRFRDDGVAPTSTIGMPLSIGTMFTYSGPLAVVQFIQQAATATLDITYYK